MAAPNLTFKNDGSFLEQFRKQAGAPNTAPPPPMPSQAAQPPPPPPGGADPAAMQQHQGGYDPNAAYYGYAYGAMDPNQQMAAAGYGAPDPNAYAAQYYASYYGMGIYPGGFAAAAAAAGYQPAGLNAPNAPPAPMPSATPDFMAGGHPEMMRGQPTRTLWLGNIAPQTSEDDIRGVFHHFGSLESVRMLHHKGCAFVTFGDMKDAAEAWKHNMGLMLHGMSVRIGWGKPEERSETADMTGSNNQPCRNLWVGNLTAGMTEDQLRSVFSAYGTIESIKVLQGKNCAFVHFHTVEEAQAARSALNGRALADRTMRINYGKDNGPRPGGGGGGPPGIGMPPGGGPGGPAPWETGGGGGMGGQGGPPMGMPPAAAPATPPPGFALPPSNADLQKIVDKMVTFIVRNGPLFEESVKVRERENPKFRFLFGGDGADYYNWKVYAAKHGLPDNAPPPAGFVPTSAGAPPMPGGGPPPAAALPPSSHFSSPPPSHAPPSQQNYPPPSYHQQPPPQYGQPPPQQHEPHTSRFSASSGGSQPHVPPPQPAYPYSAPAAPLPAPLGPDVSLSRAEEEELEELIQRLSGTKESIKSGKDWILARGEKSRAIVRLLVRRVAAMADDATKRLHVVYLINDVLHHAVKKTAGDTTPDSFSRALAEDGLLSRLCQAAYIHQPSRTQEQLVKVLNLWADRGIYETPFINEVIADMKNSVALGKRTRDDEPRDDNRGRSGSRWS